MPALPFIILLYMISQGLHTGFLKKVQQDYIRHTSHSFLFSAVSAAGQLILVLVLPPYIPLGMNADAWAMGAGFTVFYTGGMALLFVALGLGPMGLTNVIFIIRNFIPILAGVLFWNEGVTAFQGLGLLVFIVSLALINRSIRQGGDRRPTLRWMLITLAAGLSTGVAVCFSKLYGFAQPVAFKAYLAAFNLLIPLALAPYLAVNWRRHGLSRLVGDGRFWLYTMLSSLGITVTNILFMYYINSFSSALYFPALAILAVLTTVLVGRIFYRERVGWAGWAGVALSVVAIWLLNL